MDKKSWEEVFDNPAGEGDWEEDPVNFKTWVENEKYCNHPALSDEAYRIFTEALGEDPKKIFTRERKIKEIVLNWGKGCLAKGTVIKDVITGEEHRINGWCKLKRGFNVKAYNEKTGEIVITKTNPPFCKGIDKIYKIKIKVKDVGWSFVFYVTKEHKVLTENGWKKIDELNVGDNIFVEDNINSWIERNEKISKKLKGIPKSDEAKRKAGIGIHLANEKLKKEDPIKYEELCQKHRKAGETNHNLPGEIKKLKFGNPGKKHPLYGTKMPEESIVKMKKTLKYPTGKFQQYVKSYEFEVRMEKQSEEMKNGKSDYMNACLLKKIDEGTVKWGGNRTKYYKFVDKKGRQMMLQGTYELRMGIVLDKLDIEWCKNKDRFDYIYKGEKHKYKPDFKVIKNDGSIIYLETKGFVTELVRIKLQAVRNKGIDILLLTLKEIEELEKNPEKLLYNHFEHFDYLKKAEITSIEYVGDDYYYDFEVPEYHNYFLNNGTLHHNSGKDTSGSLLQEYCIYILLCMKSPHKMFNLAVEDPISLVNVAMAGPQSGEFFEKFSNRVETNNWFRANYRITKQGKKMSYATGTKGIINIAGTTIEFPKNLIAVSLNSHQEAWEGKNVIFGICNEISGFVSEKGLQNADKIYKSITTSARELPQLLLMVSFPRLPDDYDFIAKKYEESKKYPEFMLGSRKYTWQIKPARFYCGETFDFIVEPKTGAIEKVPIEYKNEFIKNPENAKAKYMCIVSGSGESNEQTFFEYMDWNSIKKIPLNIKTDNKFITIQGKDGIFVQKILVSCIKSTTPRIITFDASEVECDTSMCILHKEIIAGIEMIVCDGLIVWEPSRERKISVDLDNVTEMIKILKEYFPIIKVKSDHWNSAIIEHSCNKFGIKAERGDVSLDDYDKMKSLYYTGQLLMPDQIEYDKIISQLKSLRSRGVSKPKVAYGKQDIVDSLALGCGLLCSELKPTSLPGGRILGGVNLNAQPEIENFLQLKKSMPTQGMISTAQGKSKGKLPNGVLLGGRSHSRARQMDR